MKKIINILLISLTLLTASCTEEEIDTTARILALTFLYKASHSHYDGRYHYYKTRECSSSYQYYYGQTNITTSCRYYGDYNGYFVRTITRYSYLSVYR